MTDLEIRRAACARAKRAYEARKAAGPCVHSGCTTRRAKRSTVRCERHLAMVGAKARGA